MLIHGKTTTTKKERKDKNATELCGLVSDVLLKIIYMSVKRSVLGSKMVFKFRGPEQQGCLNCMKACNVRHLFHYD